MRSWLSQLKREIRVLFRYGHTRYALEAVAQAREADDA
jgi:hypothetical protein